MPDITTGITANAMPALLVNITQKKPNLVRAVPRGKVWHPQAAPLLAGCEDCALGQYQDERRDKLQGLPRGRIAILHRALPCPTARIAQQEHTQKPQATAEQSNASRVLQTNIQKHPDLTILQAACNVQTTHTLCLQQIYANTAGATRGTSTMSLGLSDSLSDISFASPAHLGTTSIREQTHARHAPLELRAMCLRLTISDCQGCPKTVFRSGTRRHIYCFLHSHPKTRRL